MTHKSHRHILTLIAAALCLMLAACHHASPYRATLDAADSLMESRPDSALSLLRAIPSEQITDRATRARHAMLHAMARDKNYIDDTTFTILQPAIDYYENHGTPTEKLRTFYYQGRISQNRGQWDKAMQYFQKALIYGNLSNDFLTKARTYFAQMLIEDNMFDFYETIKDGKTAAFYFKKMNRPDSYAHCLMYLANIYATALMNDSVIKYISLCKSMLPNLSSYMRNEFYGTYISSVSDSCGKDSLNRLIQEYLEAVPESDLDTLSLANLYNQATEPDKALSLLLPFKGSKNNRSRYYSIIHSSYAQKGMYKEAYETHSKYMALRDTIEQTQNALGTRFVKPKQLLEQQIKATEQSRALVILTAIACILALSGWLFVVYQQLKAWRRRKKEAEAEIENQRRQKAAAEQEAREYAARHSRMSEEMQTLQQNLEESKTLNRTAKTLMTQRLALLNELIAEHIGKHTDNHSLVNLLTDPEIFMKSAHQTYSITHPNFIHKLQEHQLTEWEIGYCCLFAMGLNAKQAGLYIKKSNAYQINSAIRKKLGLGPNETNLNLYIIRISAQDAD